ncbi:MAG: ATP-binding cassette domain-containing protein [Spirochaetales bacterium]|nr:ATP-binding cassette domain-containing protein [Spirochaetales bacterium]MCF7938372.1 ATP-binding cassette domain-containing protein [Spirochaetales bacterium]
MLLEVRNLTKRFRGRGISVSRRKSFLAVDNVSFSVQENTIFGLVGESGSGKTTVARTVLFLDPPSEGAVLFRDIPLHELSSRELRMNRRRMQIIFQDPNAALNPKLTIRKSMEEGLKNRKIEKTERARRIDELLELVGISPSHKDRYPHEFSGGQKQRIVIARALSMEPDFLILDEPVSNLDVSIQAQIINLLLELKRKFSLTYLFISHDLNLVSYLSDTIAVMYSGRIVETGPAEQIISDARHPYTVHLFSSIPGAGQAQREGQAAALEAAGQAGAVQAGAVQAVAPEAAGQAKAPQKSVNTGCTYYDHCSRRAGSCLEAQPDLIRVGPDHYAACYYPVARQGIANT